MFLTITFRILASGQEIDIQMNKNGSIASTLEVLASQEILPRALLENLTEVYSVRKREQIDIKETYEESKIYTGDLLCI